MSVSYTRPIASIRDGEGVVVGAGWLALGRYVVTCAHVVADALGLDRETTKIPAGLVRLDLPFLGKMGLSARVVAWYPVRPLADLVRDQLADVAVLELEGDQAIEGGIDPRMVDRRVPARGTPFLTCGFPNGFDNGTEAGGEVLVKDAGGWLQVRDTQGFGYFIRPGFSGAPVVSQTNMRLIGMATAADGNDKTRLAFLLPSQLICRGFPLLAKPYRGLFAFGEEEADLFFGRDGFIDELETKLERHPFAAVIGPSGSGKSSVVLAGLVPRLQMKGWKIVVCRPSRDPLLQLGLGIGDLTSSEPSDFEKRNKKAEEWKERLLKDPGRIVDLGQGMGGAAPDRQTPTLVVIDQFEELFTYDANAPDEVDAQKAKITLEGGSPRQAQLLAVLEAIARQPNPKHAPVRVVVTMRADFMDQALNIRRLAGLLQDADVKLGPMTAAELTEAIREPARAFDVEFEDGLTEELVATMQGRPGGLPLLQFALERLWRKQDKRQLSWAAYRGADGKGGLETALDEHAEKVVGDLGAAALPGVRRLMLRLVRLGEAGGTPDARAVVRRSEIGETDWPLAQKLSDEHSRLLMLNHDPATGEETAEVVHEALIGAWGRLRNWLVDDRSLGLWRQRLKDSVEAWSTSQDSELLLRGRRLVEAIGWRENRGEDLNANERAFIEASDNEAKRKAEEELNQAKERERLANELAEAALQREATAIELSVVAQDLASTRGRALAQAQDASMRQKRANRWLGLFVALLVVALAVGTYFFVRGQEAEADAIAAAQSAEEARAKEAQARQTAQTAEASAIAAAQAAESARLKESEARQAAQTAERQAQETAREAKGRQLGAEAVVIQRDLAGSENAERAAALAVEGWRRFPTASAYQAAVTALRTLPLYRIEHGDPVNAVAFSPDGTLIATGSSDKSARLIRTADGKEVARIEHGGSVNAVAFSPDGTLIATGSSDKSARLIRTADGKEVARIEHGGSVNAVAFSPNGTLLATGSADNGARLIRTADGKEVARVEHGGMVLAVAFSPDGTLLATGSWDNSARLIRTTDGSEVARIEHGDSVNAVAFSPDGTLLATGSSDNSARLIRTTDGSEVARIEHGDSVNAVAFSPDGTLLATASSDNNARLIRTSDGSEAARIEHINFVNAVAFSPDGALLATGDDEHSARLIRTADGSEVARVEHGSAVSAVAFSPDGTLLATGSWDNSARLIPTADASELARIEHGGPVYAVAFSPDGTLLATGGWDNSARLIRTADGGEVARIEHGSTVNAVTFSPDGTLLATGSWDNSARLIRTTDGSEVARIEHGGSVRAVSFSPDGMLLATASKDGRLRLIRTTDGREAARIFGGTINAIAFSSDGTLLAAGSQDGSALLIRTADGGEAARIEHGGTVNDVAFSPDGTLLATGSGKGSVRLIRIADGSEIVRIEYDSSVRVVVFSPDGTLLATGSDNGSARLIRTADGSEVARIEHGNWVGAVAFSPDGALFATGSADTSARLIRIADGNEIARIEHGDIVYAVAFSPDGTLLATGSSVHGVRLLPMPKSVFEKLCRERIGRNLKADEWRQYVSVVEEWAPTCQEWRSDPELFAPWKARSGPGIP